KRMTVDQGIGLAGIIIAVIIAASITTKVVNRSRTQRQSVGTRHCGDEREQRISRRPSGSPQNHSTNES
ncbi:hypothetical protein, partial [Neisseria gonorrhoeae]|uniref:hypothetical protein n=1 Tax=Neisseria gonorrhoeae TaxID=485 RepID=UPI001B7FC931